MTTHDLVRRDTDTVLATVLWFAGLFGFFGLHRLYMGRWVSGLLWFCTGGLCFVGQLVDLFLLPRMCADARDGRGGL